MTDLERCHYVRTVKTASTAEPFKSEYDELIFLHHELFFDAIHIFRYFLPWHRWYVLAFENLLRKIDCRVTVPYWDWSLDPEDAWESDIWNDDLCKYTGLGGNGVGDDACVVTGPFAYPNWTMTPSTGNACLYRRFPIFVVDVPPDCTAVQGVLDATTEEFFYFQSGIEKLLHDTVHVQIGGAMNSRDSSNAPEFFLHHGFIDKVWGDWQLKGLNYKRHEYYHNTTSMPGTTHSPKDVHCLDEQPYHISVRYDQPTLPCKVGNLILPMANISRLSLSERLKISPTPLPNITLQALNLFNTPQTVIDHLPAVARRLFGVNITITE